ncbi:NAD(P)-dependent oxidoreductase [Botrimarina sp.]|uniref:NAD(P)-dependent oxidoreductase n=1 Tax=Botrimarina sp. TaxID=2795802 RepID=UPI0032EFBF4B
MSDFPPLAYIGTGIMGAAMARNLLRAGAEVTVCNRTRAKAEQLEPDGAMVVDTPAEAVDAGARVVFVNVPDTPDVGAVLFGEGGVATAAADKLDGLIVVDNSTISPIATKEFASRLEERGARLVDAPVSGGDVGAQKGTLSVMCGGQREAFDAVRPLLEVVGSRVTHLGPPGSGQACKACNQVAGAAALAGVCEALALAWASGLDLAQVIGVVSGGASASWPLENLGPKIAAGDYAPGFMVELLQKDLRLVAGAAEEHGLPMPVTRLVEALLQSAAAAGHGRDGTQALADAYQRLGAFSYAGEPSGDR